MLRTPLTAAAKEEQLSSSSSSVEHAPTSKSNNNNDHADAASLLDIASSSSSSSWKACIERNQPTVETLLSSWHFDPSKHCRDVLRKLRQRGMLRPYRSLHAQLMLDDHEHHHHHNNSTPTKREQQHQKQQQQAATLRHVQLQFLLRCRLWQVHDANYCHAWSKLLQKERCKNVKKAKTHHVCNNETMVLDELLSIMSLAAVRLPPSLLLRAFVQECGQLLAPPDGAAACWRVQSATGEDINLHTCIVNFFELHNVSVNTKMRRPTKKRKRIHNATAPTATTTTAASSSSSTHATMTTPRGDGSSTNIANDAMIVPTAPTLLHRPAARNPLLTDGGRARFTGTHFTTNLLSNPGALFRPVQVGHDHAVGGDAAAAAAAAAPKAPPRAVPHSVRLVHPMPPPPPPLSLSVPQQQLLSTNTAARKLAATTMMIVHETPRVDRYPLSRPPRRPAMMTLSASTHHRQSVRNDSRALVAQARASLQQQQQQQRDK